MKPEFLLYHCENILQEFISQRNSPAKISKRYFNQNHVLGSKERYAVNELTYFSLRNYYLSEYISGFFFKNVELRSIFLSSLLLLELPENSYLFDNIKDRLRNDQIFINFKNNFDELLGSKFDYQLNDTINKLNDILFQLSKKNDIKSLSIYYSVDINIIENLLKIYDIDKVKDYLKGLNLRSLPEIRINYLKSDKKNITDIFKNILIDEENLSPSCIKLNKHFNFNTFKEYSEGLFEVQSDGSQVISLLAYNHEQTILDACAGAGGKSLHLADLSKNKANITALDTDKIKIKELIKRKIRAGADSIFAFSVKPFNANILKDKKYELVLIDAPCSGTGTANRDPSRKIFLKSKKISSYADYQMKVLEYYSKFVDSHGKLIYATCSILPKENELVVERFLKANIDFELYEPTENLINYNLKHKLSSNNIGFYRVHPLHHSTDGFFIATLRKKA